MAPIPNKRISDINGHKLEYAKDGEGRPIIVFINGLNSEMDYSWNKVYGEAKKLGTVFVYNRFGVGVSDKADEPQTGAKIVATLQELLRKNNLNPPYILVGHSIGGLYANLFGRLYPQEVSGAILIDSHNPDQEKILRDTFPGVRMWALEVIAWPFWNIYLAIYGAFHPNKYSESAAYDETVSQLKRAGPFPDIPLTVISAGKVAPLFSKLLLSKAYRQAEKKYHHDLVTLSPQGKLVIAENSDHFVQNDEPMIVIREIHEIADKSYK